MTAADLLRKLTQRGVRLKAINDRLMYYPRDAVTAEQVELLRTYKAELLALLQSPLPSAPPDLNPPWPAGLEADIELAMTVAELSPAGYQLWVDAVRRRQENHEPAPGLGWRALVDVRTTLRGTLDGWPAAS